MYSVQKREYYVFLIPNTLGLSTSFLILIHLTHDLSLRFEVWVATASMFATYASATFAIAPDESVNFRYVLLAAAGPFAVRGMIQINRKRRSILQRLEMCFEGD
ncbi:hypothetical protein NMG60_11023166 [Bertholletia excelsa]